MPKYVCYRCGKGIEEDADAFGYIRDENNKKTVFCSDKCFEAWNEEVRKATSDKRCKWYLPEYKECMKATKVLVEAGIAMKALMGSPKGAHFRNNDCMGNLGACHCKCYNEAK